MATECGHGGAGLGHEGRGQSDGPGQRAWLTTGRSSLQVSELSFQLTTASSPSVRISDQHCRKPGDSELG